MRRSRSRSIWFWLLVAVLIILVLGLIFGGYRKGTPVSLPEMWCWTQPGQSCSY